MKQSKTEKTASISIFTCIVIFLAMGMVIEAEETRGFSAGANYTILLLSEAREEVAKMVSDGLPVRRYNDTLELAEQLLEAQLELEKNKGSADYKLIQDKIEEVGVIKQKAYNVLDELHALEMTIKQAENINQTIVNESYKEALHEFQAERFDESMAIIKGAYEEISELQATETKVKAMYDATSRGVINFIKRQYKATLTILISLLVIFLLTKKQISILRIKSKIIKLEKRRDKIKELIAQTQQGYFERKEIDETRYHIRTKKYAELVRDINRQIPLLKEQLAIKRKEYIKNR